MRRDKTETSGIETGRDEPSARLFLRPFPQAARLRADRVVKALHSLARREGVRVYLVGGLLRNLALSCVETPDYDIVIDGDTGTFARLAARSLRAAAFMLDKGTGAFRVVSRGSGRKSRVVLDISPIKGGSLIADLRARDFTVDALGMEISSVFSAEPCILDPTGGFADAARSRLAAVAPGVFDDDPLRVLRAVRLSQRYSLEIDAATLFLMSSKAPLLKSVSVERIRDELLGIFSWPGTAESIELCYASSIIDAVLPPLAGWADVDGYDLKTHTLRAVEEAELIAEGIFSGGYLSSSPGLKTYLGGSIGPVGAVALFKLSAFLHDAGKPLTISRETGRLRFICHEQKGRDLAGELLTGLKFSRKAAAFVSTMAANHHRLFMYASLERPSPRAKAHFFRSAGAREGLMLVLLALADARATRGSEDPELLEAAEGLLRFYYATYVRRRPRPLLTGREVMKEFGVPEGSEVGRILAAVSEGVERGEVSTRAEAIEYIKRRLNGGRG